MVSRRTRVASWIFRRDHPSRPNAMICCLFSSFKTFAMLREATYPPAAVNVLDVSSESMAAFQVFMYGRFRVFTEGRSRKTFPTLTNLADGTTSCVFVSNAMLVEKLRGVCGAESLLLPSCSEPQDLSNHLRQSGSLYGQLTTRCGEARFFRSSA